MKKVMFPVGMLFVAIIAAFSSCGGQNKTASDVDSLAFDSIVVDTVAMLDSGKNDAKCEISLSVLYAKGTNAEVVNDSILTSGIFNVNMYKPTLKAGTHADIRQAVDDFVAAYIADYLESLSRTYKAANLDGLKEKGVFAFSEPFVPDNFVLGKDSVTFVYQPYEIAAYALGTIKASVAYSDLDKVIVKK